VVAVITAVIRVAVAVDGDEVTGAERPGAGRSAQQHATKPVPRHVPHAPRIAASRLCRTFWITGSGICAAVYKLVVHDELVYIAAVELISGFLDPVL